MDTLREQAGTAIAHQIIQCPWRRCWEIPVNDSKILRSIALSIHTSQPDRVVIVVAQTTEGLAWALAAPIDEAKALGDEMVGIMGGRGGGSNGIIMGIAPDRGGVAGARRRLDEHDDSADADVACLGRS